MDEQPASDHDAAPPQPRTVGRASVPGLTPVRPDEPLPPPKSATTYTAGRPVADQDDVDDAPRVPAPRSSEPGLGAGLPAALRGVSEPLPRRRARSINEFTDGPDPSSGGTPWSPFGADEKPPPPDPNAYRVRATARVPGYLPEMNAPSVDADREDRILPDGPLVNELFFDGPPVNRSQSEPASAADYAAALMREWNAEEDSPRTPPETAADEPPSPHSSWSTPVAWDADAAGFGMVNSGRARNVPIETIGDLDDPVPPDFGTAAGAEVPDAFVRVPDAALPSPAVPFMAADAAMPSASVSDAAVSDSGHAAPVEPEPARGGLLGLFGDSFDDLSFDRIPFERADAVEESPAEAGPEPAEAPAPDFAARYGTAPAGDPAAVVDTYWGSAGPEPDPPAATASPLLWSDLLPVEPAPAESLPPEPWRVEPPPAARATASVDAPIIARASVPAYPPPVAPDVDEPGAEPPVPEFAPAGTGFNEPQFNEPQFNEPQFNEPQFNEPQFNEPQFNEPQFNESRFNEPQFNESRFNEPQFNEQGFNDPGFAGPGPDEQGFDQQSFDELGLDRPGTETPAADLPGSYFWNEPEIEVAPDAEVPPAPVIGTIRAAVRVPGLVIERPPAAGSDEDRPLAVPVAVERPAEPAPAPRADVAADPAPDGPIVTYAADDWRRNVRGAATVSSDAGGTVYVADVEDEEDEPISTTQKVLRSGVIALLVVIFVIAFRYGPSIDEWLHS